MDWSISRRQFIAFTSAYAVFQSQLPIPWPRAETATGRVRENIRVFAEDPEKVTALRLAIKTMKEKSANNKHDPLGWDYWAAVHGTDEAVPPNLESIYNQCVHRGTHFLSWHRAFLFYFEAVLKRSAEEAGASAQIELPYWDWYSDPVLPAIFTDQKTNPLWHPRATEDLTGVTLYRNTFTFKELLPAADIPAVKTFSRSLEWNPHNTVHGIVGGDSQDMGDPQKSARDPIFWLHHANIDRLWSAWMKGGNRLTPPSDSEWGKTSWQFDEKGQWRQTAGAILDSTKPPLGYRYDDETMPMFEILVATAPQPEIIETKPSPGIIEWLKGLQGAIKGAPTGTISTTSGSVKLGNDTVAVDLKIPAQEANQLSNWAARGTSDVESATLVFQNIKVLEANRGFSFTVLVSLPGAESKLPRVAVGELGPFSLGVVRHHTHGNKPTLELPLSEILPAFDSLSPGALESGLRVIFEPAHPPKEGSPQFIEIAEVRLDVTTAQ